jgi:hypothetical protein
VCVVCGSVVHVIASDELLIGYLPCVRYII